MKTGLIVLHIIGLILLSSCKNSGSENNSLDSTFMNPTNPNKFNSKISSIQITPKNITLNGTGLDKIKSVKVLKTKTNIATDIKIDSQTASNLIGAALKNIQLAAGEAFSVIISDASGQTVTVDATFIVENRSITVDKLSGALGGVDSTGVNKIKNGQTLSWSGNNWVAVDQNLNSQNFIGIYDAYLNTPAIELQDVTRKPNPTVIIPRSGDYYIVQGSGGNAYVNCFDQSCPEPVSDGDWLMWNDVDSKWDIVKNVYSAATPTAVPWSNIEKTGSKLQDIQDVSGTPIDGKGIIYSLATHRWVFGNPIPPVSSVTGGVGGSIAAGTIDRSNLSPSLQTLLDGLTPTTSTTSQITAGSITATTMRVTGTPTQPTDVVNKSYVDALVNSISFWKKWIGEALYATQSVATLTYTYENNNSNIDLDKSNSIVVKSQTKAMTALDHVSNGGQYTIVFQDDANTGLTTDFSISSYGNTLSTISGQPIVRWNPAKAPRTVGKNAIYTITLIGAAPVTGSTQIPQPYLYVTWKEF